MPTVPAGSLALSVMNLRVMLADCATFRTLVGAADQTAALARIYREGLPVPASRVTGYTAAEFATYRPYAIVFAADRECFTVVPVTEQQRYAGTLGIALERTVAAGDLSGGWPTTDKKQDWQNIVGQICDELITLAEAAAAGHLLFEELAIELGPESSHPDHAAEFGSYQYAQLRVKWKG